MQFVIFHGSYGSPEGNWFPYLKSELEKLDQKVFIPRFPVEKWADVANKDKTYLSNIQTLDTWMQVFDELYQSKNFNEPTCFIGHSIGSIFILHILEKYNIKLDSAIFVSPFLQVLSDFEFNAVNNSFYKSDFDFEKLKNLINISYAVYSDNDAYVPLEQPILFAEKMNSQKILVRKGKHLNDENPQFKKFPLILELCKTRFYYK